MSTLLVRCLRCEEEYRVLPLPGKAVLPVCPECGGRELLPLALLEAMDSPTELELIEV